MKVKFVSQPFLTNGSDDLIHQKRFLTKSKNAFSGQTMRDFMEIECFFSNNVLKHHLEIKLFIKI